MFPSEDYDFCCVMIRDVGEDPLSPALRDIVKERGRARGPFLESPDNLR